ncbi:MAG TPA: MFS transporter [Acidimicrobiales bacterium]|nr:MFS transporter [Acidimicrobiales bacterium]
MKGRPRPHAAAAIGLSPPGGALTRWMASARSTGARTFEALQSSHNFRLYFFGQIVSMSGTWMQTVAQGWLVLRLTGSTVDLGAVTAVQFLPVLIGGPWGGVVADRVRKRRLLVMTQTVSALLALALGLLTATGAVRLWMVFVLAAGLGCVNSVDNPTRQAFVMEMVGADRVANAVSLNSVVMNSARVVGPAVAGILIATVGLATCFLVNAGSFIAVIVGLLLMRASDLHPTKRAPRAKGQLRAGLRYVRSERGLLIPLVMMAVVGTLAYNFNVTLPALARFTFHRGATAYGVMSSAMGAGAVIGGLITASRGRPTNERLTKVAAVFGGLILVCAAMPDLWSELAALAVMGAFSISFIATANATLQLTADPAMRGRVMALYAVAFLGSTPVGGPIVGWVAQAFGPRAALCLGGAATVVAAGWGRAALAGHRPRLRRRRSQVPTIVPIDLEANEVSAGDSVAGEIVAARKG